MSEPDIDREACSHTLNRVYQFHDQALTEEEAAEIRHHLMACEPCLDQYDVEQALRLLIRRGCGSEHAPDKLRMRIRASFSRTVIVNDNG